VNVRTSIWVLTETLATRLPDLLTHLPSMSPYTGLWIEALALLWVQNMSGAASTVDDEC